MILFSKETIEDSTVKTRKSNLNMVVKVLSMDNSYFPNGVNRRKSASTIISTKALKSTFGIQPNFWRALVVSDKSRSASDGRKSRGS